MYMVRNQFFNSSLVSDMKGSVASDRAEGSSSFSFAPPSLSIKGACCTHGLRHGLHSSAASRLLPKWRLELPRYRHVLARQ